MTWTVSHPGVRSRPGVGSIRWPRGLAAIGMLSLLLSAWGAIVPYLGPTFSYSADGTSAWTWTFNHAMLWLVPGAVGMVASLAVMSRARGGRLAARMSLAFWGLVLFACAAWFVLGPSVWPVLGRGMPYTPASDYNRFLELVGFNLGIGVVMAAFAGMVIKSSTGERELGVVSPAAASADETSSYPEQSDVPPENA